MTNAPDASELAARAAAAAAAAARTPTPMSSPIVDPEEHASVEALSDAAEGLPDETTARTVLAHAEACLDCGAHVADLTAVMESVHLLQNVTMPETAVDQIRRLLLAQAQTRAAAEETDGAAAHRRLVERTTLGTFGANAPRSIDSSGLGLAPAGE